MVNQITTYEYDLARKGKIVTIDNIDKHVSRKFTDNKDTFINFIDDQINKSSILRQSTVDNHKIFLKKLKEFDKIKSFEDLTLDNIISFDNWLRSTGRVQQTIHAYHKRMKVYIKKAIDNEHILYNPYNKFKVSRGKSTERKYLTDDELLKLENKEFTIKRLEVIRDVFLFQCYTGLSYADLEKLSIDNVFTDDNGNKFIKTYRSKSNEKSTIYLIKKAQELITKYMGNHKLMPVLTNQKYNGFLKEVAAGCDLEKELTTHMARHTFATTITLKNGVPIETVSKALGHTSLKTTQIYAKIIDKKVIADMIKLDNI